MRKDCFCWDGGLGLHAVGAASYFDPTRYSLARVDLWQKSACPPYIVHVAHNCSWREVAGLKGM